MAVIVVLLVTITPVAALPPTVTVAPAANPVPEIVIEVPPAAGPDVGLTPVTVGAVGAGAVYVKPWARVAVWLSELVTITSTTPAVCAPVVAVIVLLLVTATFVAAVPPRETVAPDRMPLPEIVTEVPPAVGPEFGV